MIPMLMYCAFCYPPSRYRRRLQLPSALCPAVQSGQNRWGCFRRARQQAVVWLSSRHKSWLTARDGIVCTKQSIRAVWVAEVVDGMMEGLWRA